MLIMKAMARRKVGIPVTGDEGGSSVVSRHFGKAPLHLVVKVGTGEVLAVVGKPDGNHGGCAPLDSLLAYRVDCVVSVGMGNGARERLRAAGVEVLRTEARTVREVLEALREGRLGPHGEEHLCAGHH